jgi:tRNA (Thr-GGU) A37 N-methylase
VSDDFTLYAIGRVVGGRDVTIDDDWDAVHSRIELDPAAVEPDATAGLDAFSHIEVVFLFDRVDPDGVCRGARHPRGNSEWPSVGILAQRAKDRPNRLGLTVCRLVAARGLTLEVTGLDAVDGTPVLDIKPYMHGFAPRGDVREPQWATELMTGYW